MTYRGVFIDDVDEVYASLLTVRGKIEFIFEPLTEVSELAATIMKAQPMVVAIDYRLDGAANVRGDRQTYKGSALAQHLRDAVMDQPRLDFAIVLVSAEDNIRNFFKPDITAHDLFDRVYVKKELAEKGTQIPLEVLSLAQGYDCLRQKLDAYDLVELTNASETDLEFIDAQELRLQVETAKAPHHVAKAFSKFVIRRSGILLSTQDACALFGLDVAQAGIVGELLGHSNVAYDGLFAGLAQRWWAKRTEALAEEMLGERPGNLTSGERAKRMSAILERDMAPALSPWTGKDNELIVVPCACCERGTELRHSVAAYEPALPRFIKRRRICWDCVQRDKVNAKFPHLIVDEADESLASRIKLLDRDAYLAGLSG